MDEKVRGKKSTSKRSGLSHSKYANPDSLIHNLAKSVQDWIYFPDPMPLYLVLGVLAGNMLKGVPVWVMVVGPSSGGKTLALEMLHEIERVHFEGAMKGHSAFLSGSSKKDTAKNATGGVLRQFKVVHEDGCDEEPGCRCPTRGMLVVKDFSEVLACAHEPLVETIGALRGIYDGQWTRSIGSDGGRKITWRGRIGFLGACTSKIDSHHSVIQELGQRWLYFRYDQTDGFGEAQKSLINVDREKMHAELCRLVKEFIDMSGLAWESKERRVFELFEMNRLISMSSLMVRARSRSTRDWKSKEVIDEDDSEAPSRMASALGQLYLGLEAIGLEADYCWRIVEKVALDSCPRLSMMVLKAMAKAGKAGLELKEVKKAAGLMCSPSTVARTVEDLVIFKVLEYEGSKVRLTSMSALMVEAGFKGGLQG